MLVVEAENKQTTPVTAVVEYMSSDAQWSAPEIANTPTTTGTIIFCTQVDEIPVVEIDE